MSSGDPLLEYLVRNHPDLEKVENLGKEWLPVLLRGSLAVLDRSEDRIARRPVLRPLAPEGDVPRKRYSDPPEFQRENCSVDR